MTKPKHLIMLVKNLATVLSNKLQGNELDYFLKFKYDLLKDFYGVSCLDIGAGTGRFSRHLKDKGHNVTPVDIVDKSRVDLDFKLFDGCTLPIKDKAVDTSIFMFVLHHAQNQLELLTEAIRVTKKYVIVGEDVMENAFDKLLGGIHLNTSPWSKAANSFHTEKDWINIFSLLGLKLVHVVQIPRYIYPVYPVSRSIYVLEVDNSTANKN